MIKVCKKHREKPAFIYGQCIGCELEWYQKRINELELEIKDLKYSKSTESPNEVGADKGLERVT